MADAKKSAFLVKFAEGKQLNSVELIKIWTSYDKDGSGYLETKELDNFLRDLLATKHSEKDGPVTEKMISSFRASVLEQIDANNDGKVEFGEFVSMIPMEENFMKKFTARKSLTRQNFDEIFRHYDPDGNGYIQGKELMALIHDIMAKTDEKVSVRDMNDYRDAMLKVFDKNSDGKLSKKELGLLLSTDKP